MLHLISNDTFFLHWYILGFQRAHSAEDSCRQVCQEGATRARQRELGNQADAMAAHHADRVVEPPHACCLLGCAANFKKQGMI